MKPLVAHVRLNYLPLSEPFVYNEIRGVKRYRTMVLCWETENLDSFPHPDVRALSELNFVSYYFNRLSMRDRGTSSYFRKVLKDTGASVLHAQFGDAGARTIGLKEDLGIPHVTSFRGYDVYAWPKERPGAYDRLFREGDLFLTRSKAMSEDLEKMGAPGEKLKVHHSALDLKDFRFRKREPPGKGESVRVLTVGRLTAKKGMEDTIAAFARVAKGRKDLRLTVVGDGPMRGGLEALVREKGLERKVRLTGHLSHDALLKEYRKAHVFMLGCKTGPDGDREGIPNVLMEAQAVGLPVVATSHAGIPEAVPEGVRRSLAPEGDREALADSLAGTLDRADRWGDVGREGRRHVEERFGLERQSRKLEAIYSRLLLK